ncbi:MAG: hypothetical protein M1823_000205 [Watsoniomyces obsoletus]|nr:MAG: hypothetical protein M1823_000205 [Watsoniomyces obsoletus]
MVLTRQTRSPPNPDAFPTTQLFILAICRLAEPIALTSIFPYAFPMVKHFHVGDESNAGLYAGILISAFALSESMTCLYWGMLSDRIGRKPVLLFGCVGTMLSLLVVGFSSNFWLALVGRALGGFLNGNVGVIQTMVGELVTNPAHEPRAYAVMPFVWSIGTIVGPALGGTLANPAANFPAWFSQSGLFAKFPYLLPNLICAALLFGSVIMGYWMLEETHPDHRPGHHGSHQVDVDATTALMATTGATNNAPADLRAESYGTFNAVDITGTETWRVNSDGSSPDPKLETQKTKRTYTRRVVMLVVALGIFTYHSMTYDHLLPIFLEDDRVASASATIQSHMAFPGGLGLSMRTVGAIMTFNGLIAMVVQGVIFPIAAECLGVWKVFVLTALLHPLAYLVVPFLVWLPEEWLFPGIYACLTLRNLFSILAYPVILILLKEASPSHAVLGKINGLAASAGGVCRTLAPPIAGFLYGVGARQGCTGLAWWGSAIVAVVGSVQCFFVERDRYKKAHVQSAASGFPCRGPPPPKTEIIHITVDDVDA